MKKLIKTEWIQNILLIIICLLLVVGINYCFSPIIVNGTSMQPLYQENDFLISSKIAYKNMTPQRGDVVIIDGTNYGHDMYFIKRVIGLAGDTVKIKDGQLFINNQAVHEDYIGEAMNSDFAEITVADNFVFVLGDNRNNSLDSRIIGSVSIEDIQGKIVVDNDIIKNIGHIKDFF